MEKSVVKITYPSKCGLFWNSCGLEDDLDLVQEYMMEHECAFGCFSETKLFGQDLCEKDEVWEWHPGPETLPALGSKLPRLGLGVMTRRSLFPSASVVRKDKYSVWVRLPGTVMDAYVCAAYIPVYDNLKKAALKEILAGCRVYRDKGLVILGGDLNARCGCNGDPVTNKYGRNLAKGCAEESMCIVNELEQLCRGEFTRVQDVAIDGVVHTRKTTLDYVLVPRAARASAGTGDRCRKWPGLGPSTCACLYELESRSCSGSEDAICPRALAPQFNETARLEWFLSRM